MNGFVDDMIRLRKEADHASARRAAGGRERAARLAMLSSGVDNFLREAARKRRESASREHEGRLHALDDIRQCVGRITGDTRSRLIDMGARRAAGVRDEARRRADRHAGMTRMVQDDLKATREWLDAFRGTFRAMARGDRERRSAFAAGTADDVSRLLAEHRRARRNAARARAGARQAECLRDAVDGMLVDVRHTLAHVNDVRTAATRAAASIRSEKLAELRDEVAQARRRISEDIEHARDVFFGEEQRETSPVAERDAEPRAGQEAEPRAERDAEPRAGQEAEPRAERDAEPRAGQEAEPRAERDAEPRAGQEARPGGGLETGQQAGQDAAPRNALEGKRKPPRKKKGNPLRPAE